MRVGSVYMRVMDVHVYSVHLVSVIFRNAFAHDTQAAPQASWCGGHQLQVAVTFSVSPGKVNSACCITQVVNLELLSFVRQEGDVLFQQDNARAHRLLRNNVLFVVYTKCHG